MAWSARGRLALKRPELDSSAGRRSVVLGLSDATPFIFGANPWQTYRGLIGKWTVAVKPGFVTSGREYPIMTRH